MPRRYVPKRGDVVWLHFDTQAGHEQAGRRPAVVLSPETYNQKTSLALFCPNTTIDSAAIDPSDGSCRVTVTVTHPPSGDRVKIFVGLPATNWNGRFRGNGGGGFSGGSAGSLRGPLAQGYAAGATDTGHEGS